MSEARERLELAQQERLAREAAIIDARIEQVLNFIGLSEDDFLKLSEADTVGPHAREKLKGILRKYAKSPHPFRACVRDNRKRFGARVNAVCAVLKDIIRGTTKWRGNPGLDKGAAGLSQEICSVVDFDDDVVTLLEQVDRRRLVELLT